LFFRWTRFFSRRVATVATLPSALFVERFGSLGASWVFSFQPVLPPDYRPALPSSDGSWARRLTQSPELGIVAFDFPFPEMFLFLCCYRQRTLLAVAQRFVHFSAYPQTMQQDRQLSCRGDDGSFLPVLPAPLGQLQTPAARKVYSGLGADIVMESITRIDPVLVERWAAPATRV
jgi:hypothetical protein